MTAKNSALRHEYGTLPPVLCSLINELYRPRKIFQKRHRKTRQISLTRSLSRKKYGDSGVFSKDFFCGFTKAMICVTLKGQMNVFFFRLALLVYLVATVGYLVYLLTMKKEAARGAYYVLLVAFFLHTTSILARWIEARHTPITNLHEATSFLGWSLVVGYLILEWRISSQQVLGAFVTPVVSLLMIYSSLCPHRILPLPPVLQSFWLPIHATISILAYSFFILMACAGVMYLLQERQIKKKRLTGLFKRLPSLETLDRLNELALKIGFPLLTVGIISGAIWAEEAWGSYWSWDPKETWSLIMWLVYAALLHERLAVGWRGRRAAVMSLVGFGIWVVSFFVVNLFIPGAHTYVEWHG